MKRVPLRRLGKKGLEWANVRKRLKVLFARAGITSCELKWKGCWGDDCMSFAHGRKRRYLKGDELEKLVVVACLPCHNVLEALPQNIMETLVRNVIAERERQP